MLEHAQRSARASVDLAPRYRTPQSVDYVHGRCIDLSEGGMFIVAQLPCESGTLLKFECAVDGNADAVKGVARVVWRRTGDSDRPSGMGLKFVKLEAGSAEVISQLVTHARAQGKTAPCAPLVAQVRITDSVPAAAPDPVRLAEKASAPPLSPSADVAASDPAASALPAAEQQASVAPAVPRSGTSLAIWIALSVGAALLVWLWLR